ncbi:hypothetical protein [Pimelobacter simplex]|uniref:hypothetical protein n=1 Tax=Nocardioides simplex TaxID=2045 RepID=UPI00214FFBC1|nr:hypothetical protein [Pimelobacter simplex]UUW88621.1 hypothetical protein M0M43_23195 [Pimelobacter simplex]UUW98126.1 hypothetical protein M0M48_11845 [Pimelobacter simplex]
MSSSPRRDRRGASARAVLATLAAVLASALCMAPAAPAAAAVPVEDMRCRMVIWASDSVFDTSYAHDGMRHTFRGCLVKRGWSTKSHRALKNRQWRLNHHLASAECRVGDYHLSGVGRTTYKGIRVVVFKYRFDYLVPC